MATSAMLAHPARQPYVIVRVATCLSMRVASAPENPLFRPLLNLPQIPRPCASLNHLRLGTKSTMLSMMQALFDTQGTAGTWLAHTVRQWLTFPAAVRRETVLRMVCWVHMSIGTTSWTPSNALALSSSLAFLSNFCNLTGTTSLLPQETS